FLTQCLHPHRHLPSFPTRRSSDLNVIRRFDFTRADPVGVLRDGVRILRNEIAIKRLAAWIVKLRPLILSSRDHVAQDDRREAAVDRKSTRLNSSHLGISYAVFCLK